MSDQTSKPRRFRRLLLGGVAAVVLLAGAVGAAKAVEQHRGAWGMDGPIPVQMIEHRADNMLGKVSATPDQMAKIHSIIEAAAKDLDPLRASMKGTHEQMTALLTAPAIDRAAIEKLRASRAAAMEQISQRMAVAAEDAAEVLTPDQRAKLKPMLDHFWPGMHHHHDGQHPPEQQPG